MGRVEYHTGDNNKIGISIKYPAEINRKWSERFAELKCEDCEGTDISCEKEGDELHIDCNNCSNNWNGEVGKVLTSRPSGEALIDLWKIDFEDCSDSYL